MLLIIKFLLSQNLAEGGKGRYASRHGEKLGTLHRRRDSFHYYMESFTVFKAQMESAPFLDLE